jgi:serine/threonine protein kinase
VLGALLGNYRVVSELGQGGMGVVYVGRHEQLGHRVVVKVLRPEMSCNASMVRRFFNEAQAATAIRHPGIVQVFDFGTTEDGRAYFVMELLEGVTLAERLQQRRLEVVECCRIARQIANVLQAAHGAGITHRDLKPDNLFLVPDPEIVGGERVKVLDFGIAKLASEIYATNVQTRADLVMGTPSYMSPEQCRGAGGVDNRSDIYSLGCVLFKMVCGRAPFVGEGAGDIIGAHLHVPPPALQDFVPDVPAALAALVARTLQKQPAARPQTMAAVAQELDDLVRDLVAPPVPRSGPLPILSATPPRRDATPVPSFPPAPMEKPNVSSPQPAAPDRSLSMMETSPVTMLDLPLPQPSSPAVPSPATPPGGNAIWRSVNPLAETLPLSALQVALPPALPVSAGRTAPPAPAAAPWPMAVPATATPPGGNPVQRFPRAPSAQPMPQLSVTSTTLGGAAGMASVQAPPDRSRRTLLIGGLVVIGAVTAIAIAFSSESDQQIVHSDTEIAPTPVDIAGAAGAPGTASEHAPPPPPPPPPSTAADTTAAAGANTPTPSPPADDLESECRGFQVDRKWAELEQCADKLVSIDPKRAADLKTRAVEEAKTAPRIAATEAALRNHDLRRARAELDQVWTDSLELPKLKTKCAAAETQAITELASQLELALSPTCAAYTALLTKERGTQLPRVTTEAARRVPCTPISRASCDAKALAERGRELHATGNLVAAIRSYEASWYCKTDPQTAKRGFIIACTIPNVQKAQQPGGCDPDQAETRICFRCLAA